MEVSEAGQALLVAGISMGTLSIGHCVVVADQKLILEPLLLLHVTHQAILPVALSFAAGLTQVSSLTQLEAAVVR